jgi:hypothetical protein
MLRKDPQKTTGLSVLTILSIGALILYIAYVRRPPAPAPAFSLQPTKSITTRPATRETRELLSEDSLIIQANSQLLEQRRATLEQARAMRTLERTRNGARRPAPPERSALERLLRARPAAPPMTPATSPTTQIAR